MADFVYEYDPNATGQILLASYLTRKWKNSTTYTLDYPVSTLTIGGELDGQTRVTRIVEALYNQVARLSNPNNAPLLFPVNIIQKINHMSFTSSFPTSRALVNDLRPEITTEEAHRKIGADAASFIDSKAGSAIKTVQLLNRVRETITWSQPIISALLMDGYKHMKPLCLCNSTNADGYMSFGLCKESKECTSRIPWTTQAQQIIAGFAEQNLTSLLSIDVQDSIYAPSHHDDQQPPFHLPHIQSTFTSYGNPGDGNTPAACNVTAGHCKLNITTFSAPAYDRPDFTDSPFYPITATEIGAKFKSRQAILSAAGLLNVHLNDTDEIAAMGGKQDLCRKINDAALSWALRNLPEKSRERYLQYGQQLITGPDIDAGHSSSYWMLASLQFFPDNVNNIATVRSQVLITPNFPCKANQIPCMAGLHYCKLLSPGRALEWMLVDGLRNKLALTKFM